MPIGRGKEYVGLDADTDTARPETFSPPWQVALADDIRRRHGNEMLLKQSLLKCTVPKYTMSKCTKEVRLRWQPLPAAH